MNSLSKMRVGVQCMSVATVANTIREVYLFIRVESALLENVPRRSRRALVGRNIREDGRRLGGLGVSAHELVLLRGGGLP